MFKTHVKVLESVADIGTVSRTSSPHSVLPAPSRC